MERGGFVFGAAMLCAAVAHADGIDCSRATAPLDRAICAEPALLAQDRALSQAYEAELRRDPAAAGATRAAQLHWLAERRTACQPLAATPAKAAATSCLARQFALRIEALTPQPTASPGAALPQAAVPPPVVLAAADAPPPLPADTPRPLVLPAIPAARMAQAAARLDADLLPASPLAETLLHVTTPGRFAIAAHSASGAALTLVDMITGPTEAAGVAGVSDGRIDRLLDRGTYKLHVASAPGATGQVQLRVQAFGEAAGPAAVPDQGEIDTTLGDLQQRSFWFAATGAPIRLQAAGRALSEVKLWRDGRDLVAFEPATSTVEPVPGHTLRVVLFEGTLPPGTYLATAYGGPALAWADGERAMPFYLRAGGTMLGAGWVAGHMGPFGSEVFLGSPHDDIFRLDMRGPASLTVDGQTAEIARNARAPSAMLHVAVGKVPHPLVVQGAEGAPFQVRAVSVAPSRRIDRPGTYWVAAISSGLGGDEPPATPVLARQDRHGLAVLASAAPEITPGHPWHTRFNLAGVVTLNLHAAEGGRVAAVLGGFAGTRLALHPLGNPDPVPETHDAAHRPMAGVWDVPAGWYVLELAPSGRAAGVADLTVGTPGESAPLAAPGPADPSVGFGVQIVGKDDSLVLLDNDAPDAVTGLDGRALPVDLGAAPLRLSQAAGQTLAVPVVPGVQPVLAVEIGRGPVPTREAAREVTLAAPDHARLVALSRAFRPASGAIPDPQPEAARPMLRDSEPAFFDLDEGAQRSFSLDIPQGGLTRIETLGRLRTRGAIGTAFVPDLATAEANGIGQNMRAETWLRAGRYRVEVTALGSAGHLGLVAAAAPMVSTATLLPGGTVRATLRAGSGLVVPIQVTQGGRYRIDLPGLDRVFTARLEDRDGWPLRVASPVAALEQDLPAGQYRLVVSPEQTDARAVVRLARLERPAVLAGHGPHALPFAAEGEDGPLLTWREPAGRADPRSPDLWTFALAAPATVTLGIDDGMEATLDAGDGHAVARFEGAAPFKGELPPGRYTVAARSQGRNDRLDYRISLLADQLQPGVARDVALPAHVAFALAQDRVASLTSFGSAPVRATLRDAAGRVIGQYGARDDDWNVAVSSLLPAGRYTLDLDSAAPPAMQPVPPNVNDAAAPRANEPDAPADTDQPLVDQAADQTPGDPPDGTQAAAPDQPQGDQSQASQGNDAPAAPTQAAPAPARTAITLSLPEEQAIDPMRGDSGSLDATLGGGVHHLPVRPPGAGGLLLAAAASSSAVVLSLEERQGQAWRQRAEAQGTAPLIAWQGDGAGAAWRLSAWPVDGGNPGMRVAARQLAAPALPGAPRFTPVPLGDAAPGVMAAHVALGSRNALSVASATAGLLVGTWPGHALAALPAGPLAPQSAETWLVSRQPGAVSLTPVPSGAALATLLPPGATLALPPSGLGAGITAWIAEAQGQPGFAGGDGMGVAAGSAFALAAPQLSLADAGGDDGLRVAIRPVALARRPDQTLQAPWSGLLPPASATRLTLPTGARSLHATLAPGLAAISGWPGPQQVTVWSGGGAISRTLDAVSPNLLLVNTGARAAPAAVDWSGGEAMGVLRPDNTLKRFYGAAGSLDLPVQAAPGQRLIVAGDASLAFTGGGRVLRGTSLTLPGAGRVTIDHGPGLLAAWLDGPGAAPWPSPAPLAVSLPGHVRLAGPAMRLDLSPASPVLLRLRSDAPVILSFGGSAPRLFAAGAAIDRVLPAGLSSLLAVSPQDGPLSGSLDLAALPVHAASEGLGAPVALAAGNAAAFGFRLDAPRRVGLGVQAEPDRVEVSLLDDAGHVVSRGNAALLDLAAGSYVLQVQVPADSAPTIIRPAIVGTGPHPSGPPAEIVARYRSLAGLKIRNP